MKYLAILVCVALFELAVSARVDERMSSTERKLQSAVQSIQSSNFAITYLPKNMKLPCAGKPACYIAWPLKTTWNSCYCNAAWQSPKGYNCCCCCSKCDKCEALKSPPCMMYCQPIGGLEAIDMRRPAA